MGQAFSCRSNSHLFLSCRASEGIILRGWSARGCGCPPACPALAAFKHKRSPAGRRYGYIISEYRHSRFRWSTDQHRNRESYGDFVSCQVLLLLYVPGQCNSLPRTARLILTRMQVTARFLAHSCSTPVRVKRLQSKQGGRFILCTPSLVSVPISVS